MATSKKAGLTAAARKSAASSKSAKIPSSSKTAKKTSAAALDLNSPAKTVKKASGAKTGRSKIAGAKNRFPRSASGGSPTVTKGADGRLKSALSGKGRNRTALKGGSWVKVGIDPAKSASQMDAYIRTVVEKVEQSLTLRPKPHALRHLPPPDDLAAAVVDLIGDAEPNELAAQVGPFWSAAKVKEALRVPTRQALESRRKNGTLLGVKTSDGKIIYPLSQFRRSNGTVEVKPGLKPLLSALRDQPAWSVAVLLSIPAAELDGLSPLDWERQGGDPARMADLARAVQAEWR